MSTISKQPKTLGQKVAFWDRFRFFAFLVFAAAGAWMFIGLLVALLLLKKEDLGTAGVVILPFSIGFLVWAAPHVRYEYLKSKLEQQKQLPTLPS